MRVRVYKAPGGTTRRTPRTYPIGAQQWDKEDLEEEEEVDNQVQQCVHAMPVEERPKKKAEV